MSEDAREIQMDLNRDLLSMIKSGLLSMGYSISLGDDDRIIKTKYFNAVRRRVSSKCRSVVMSKEFTCPDEFKKALNDFVAKSSKGEDLNPHLSRRLLDIEYNDPMLNDWGIHHFHLSMATDPDGFVSRSGPLLFAVVNDDKIYAIDIRSHGAWTEKNLIQIIHDNWPGLIKSYLINDIIDVSDIPTDNEIGQLRKSGVNSFIKLSDGSIYAPIGGGYMASGESIEAVMQADWYSRTVNMIEQHISNNIENLASDARKRGIELGSKLNFQLVALNVKNSRIMETNSKYLFSIPLSQK